MPVGRTGCELWSEGILACTSFLWEKEARCALYPFIGGLKTGLGCGCPETFVLRGYVYLFNFDGIKISSEPAVSLPTPCRFVVLDYGVLRFRGLYQSSTDALVANMKIWYMCLTVQCLESQ